MKVRILLWAVLLVAIIGAAWPAPPEVIPVVTPAVRAPRALAPAEHYSKQFAVPLPLATKIFTSALKQGVHPELAFRLVSLESDFDVKAVSSSGALGLTQLLPSTAVQIERGVTHEQLFQPETNLRIGFKYLRGLLRMFHGNTNLALLAYNRGEDAVWADLKAGRDPSNGYERAVLKGYHGPGTIQ